MPSLAAPRLKTPPYAKAHALARSAGFAPAQGVVFVFDGWPSKRLLEREEFAGAWRAVVPPQTDPADYDWVWCAGLDVCIVTRGERLAEIAAALQQANASVDALIVARDGFRIFQGEP